jgi:hypothetical protein
MHAIKRECTAGNEISIHAYAILENPVVYFGKYIADLHKTNVFRRFLPNYLIICVSIFTNIGHLRQGKNILVFLWLQSGSSLKFSIQLS